MEMCWTGHVTHMGEQRNPYRVLVGKPLERCRIRYMDNIKVDLKQDES
jgi:hypothetical protein